MKTIEHKQLSPAWSYNAGKEAMVWQLLFTDTNVLVGQKRLLAERKALFFAIDTLTGEQLCDNYLLLDADGNSAGEGWFTGIETTRGALAFCHAGYADSPEHQGIWAIDCKSGNTVWLKSDVAFVAHLSDALLVAQTTLFGGFPERHFLLLDPLSGIPLSQELLTIEQANALRSTARSEEERQHVTLPDCVRSEELPDMMHLQQALAAKPFLLEMATSNAVTILAMHEQTNPSTLYNSWLYVWHNDTLLYSDCMEQNSERPCLNNFLMRDNRLYYSSAKSKLICVALP